MKPLDAETVRRTYEACSQGKGIPQMVVSNGFLYVREPNGSVTVTPLVDQDDADNRNQ